MLKSLVAGQQDPKQLAELAQGRLREKKGDLQLALEGHFTDHHRLQLTLLEFVEFGEKQMSQLESDIRHLLTEVSPESPYLCLLMASLTLRRGWVRKLHLRLRSVHSNTPSSFGIPSPVSMNWLPQP
jgi:hypothetical protein